MALKDIVIKDCKLQKVSTSQSKLDIVVHPMDENGDLEPGESLKIYINDFLAQNLTANEFGELKESILVNNVGDEIKVQIRDVSENIRSKIKIILKDNSNQSTANSTTQETSSHFDQAKQEAIAKLKVNPHNIVHLNESQKNDIDIVKYVIMQNGALIGYAGNNVKNNKDLAKIAIKQATHNFHYISDLLKTDIDFILELLNEFGDNFGLSGYVRNEPRIQKRLSEFSKNQSEFMIIKNKYFSEHNSLYNKEINFKSDIESLESQIKSIESTIELNINTLNKKSEFFIIYDNVCNLEIQINDLANKKNNLSDKTGTIVGVVLFESSLNSVQKKLDELQVSFNNVRNTLYDFTQSNGLQSLFSSYGFSVPRNRQIVEKRRDNLYLRIEENKSRLEIIQQKNKDIEKLKKDTIIQSDDLNNKKASLLSLYNRLKKQYPFFIDYEIEQML